MGEDYTEWGGELQAAIYIFLKKILLGDLWEIAFSFLDL